MKTDVFPFLAAICGAAFIGRAADSLRAIYAEAKNSTFIIETFDAKGIPLSLGTGFAVRSNQLASNCHVMRGAQKATVKTLDSGRSFPVEAIVGSDLRADLVLLRIQESATPLAIETNPNWSVGDSVYALGNPRGLAGTFSAGIISATRELDNVHYLQITAPISPGSSGGPILSSAGKVIGVATAAIKDAQNVNFAVSAQHLTALLAAQPQEDSLGGFFTKQEDYVRKERLVRPASGGDIVVRNFEWRNPPFYSVDGWPFTFSVFNGLRRSVREVQVVVSFLNSDFEPVDTKLIAIAGTIAPESASRAKGSVDASVARLNGHLYDRLVMDPPKISTFKLGTNSVVVKWKGSYMSGYKRLPSINGRPAPDADFLRLVAETEEKMRVIRVLSFEFAD